MFPGGLFVKNFLQRNAVRTGYTWLSSKRGNKHHYKGKGAAATGTHTRKGASLQELAQRSQPDCGQRRRVCQTNIIQAAPRGRLSALSRSPIFLGAGRSVQDPDQQAAKLRDP